MNVASSCLAAVTLSGALGHSLGSSAQPTPRSEGKPSAAKVSGIRDEGVEPELHAGLEIVQNGGYPELRVDGRPFFIHSAAFFYYRIPRDLWDPLLDRYRALGINTIDIYIPWNWHEPGEGECDFDGHTNPRRDLRSLLVLIARKGFKLIARPGPEILNEWRHGGYPDWLLERPEYKMDTLDWIEGRYAPLDNLNARDAEAAAQGWLKNATHMEHARAWMSAVAHELSPYTSHTTPRSKTASGDKAAEAPSGPLLFVQLGDDFAINRTNRVGPDFWRYAQSLHEMLAGAGLDVPVFINPTDMRVSAAGSSLSPAIGAMGQWYMHPRDEAVPLITARDAGEIEFFTEELKTQPAFPPVMIEYQAGWYAPADDDRSRPNLPESTLLSSRLLIGNGIHGFSYFPLQDTFTPAGYSVPWANRSYRWDSALSPDGDPQPRSQAVHRNSQVFERWGPLLAASHKRPDFGIISPLGAYSADLLTRQDILDVSQAVMRIERLGALATLSSELIDPQFQPTEQLLRDPILFLPVFDAQKPEFQLSEEAQEKIVAYVKRGGTLLVFTTRPQGNTIGELWKDAPPNSTTPGDSPIRRKWAFGSGEVIESSKDFYSWVSLDESLSANKTREEFRWAAEVLNGFLGIAGVQPALRISPRTHGSGDLIASQIVSNEGTGLLGNRTGGQGFLSVTNLSDHVAAEGTIDVLPPAISARGSRGAHFPVSISVPPRDSLLLPLDLLICPPEVKDDSCKDEITSAGAEFLKGHWEGKMLELAFYIPAREEVHLHLYDKPVRAELDETDTHPESTWFPGNHEYQLTIPKGAAPDFVRTLKLEMPRGPRIQQQKKSQPGKAPPEDLDCYVENAVRFPTSANAFLRTSPALVVPDFDQRINVLLMAENRNATASGYIDLAFDKPLHGAKSLVVPARGTTSVLIEFRPSDIQSSPASSPDSLFHAAIGVHTGHDRRVLPIAFLLHKNEAQEHYRFDFDRDGADEWVLESDRLRLIASPESGGRVVALMDKTLGASLSTSVGLFRDNFSFTENPPGISEERKRGRYGLSNRRYAAEWGPDAAHPVLKLNYDAPDVYPTGASIEKTLQLDGADGVQVSYRVALNAPHGDTGSGLQQQSFVAVNSFPTDDGAGGSPTRFCWQKEATGTPPSAGKTAAAVGETCTEFAREAKPFSVPDGVSKMEIRNVGRPGIEISWDCGQSCGQMTIEPKYFSALLRLTFPPLVPGAEAATYTVRIHATTGP